MIMGLRHMFYFILLVALFFAIGTFIGSYKATQRIPALPNDVMPQKNNNIDIYPKSFDLQHAKPLESPQEKHIVNEHITHKRHFVSQRPNFPEEDKKPEKVSSVKLENSLKVDPTEHSKSMHIEDIEGDDKLQTVRFHTESFTLSKVNASKYIKTIAPTTKCLIEGTNFITSAHRSNKECVCKEGWHGLSCNIPQVVFTSSYPHEHAVVLLKTPKRIIYTMPFSHEFDLLEAKLHELYNVVDVFLILESNYSAAGKPKERYLLNKLNSGFVSSYQDKIVYIPLDYFPRAAYANGWIIDELLRNHIGKIGLKKILRNVDDDDIVVVNDADELPVHETLVFLKFNDGYPEPIGFNLRHNIFGFFWQGKDDYGTSEVYGAVSVKTLRGLCDGSLYCVRSVSQKLSHGLDHERFLREYKIRLRPWSFGLARAPAGWHCSWCFTPDGIQKKLHFAHVSDEPRYGQIEGKDSLKYIEHLIKTGTWFDDKTKFIEVTETYFKEYAPSLFLDNWKKYLQLLYIPS